MSRPPSQQMPVQQKQQTRVAQQFEGSMGSKSPYLNPNFLPSPHHLNQSQTKSNAREIRQQSELNNSNSQLNSFIHHIDSLSSNPQNGGMSKKPSLLSGYHNPSFETNERNEIMPMSPLSLSGSIPRFYVPPQSPYGSSNSSAFMNGITGNPRSSPNNSSEDQKTAKSRHGQNPMSIITNQPQGNRPNSNQFNAQNPPMLSPNHQSQIHQQMLNSGFSQAVIAAATASALNTNNPQFSQLFQQQLQQLHHLQNQFPSHQSLPVSTPPANENTYIKKEPRENLSTNPSPKTTTSQSNQQPTAVLTPPTSSSINSQSSYVPEVEAISPTPEDQKENSNLQEVKDKIITEICKVEKDIASTQYQFDMLEKKQKEIKELQSRPLADENSEKCFKFTTTLAEKIYKENRKKADESHKEILKTNNSIVNVNKGLIETSFDEDIPLYHEFNDTKVSQDIRKNFEDLMKQRLIQFFKREVVQKKQRENAMIDEYDTLHGEWQKKIDKIENNFRKKQKDAKYREFYEKVFPELRKAREERERLIQKQKAAVAEYEKQKAELEAAATNNNNGSTEQGSNPNSTSETTSTDSGAQPPNSLMNNLSIENPPPDPIEEERKRIYQLAVVPPMCLDERQRRYKFINNNGFVKDPAALFKAAKNEVFWNEKEKEIFLDKLLLFGKNFEIIARFLDKKRTQDCIEYYYLTKKKINYKLLIRKQARKRKNQKPNLAALLAGNNNNNNNNNGGSGAGSSSTTASNNSFNSMPGTNSTNSNNTNGGNSSSNNQNSQTPGNNNQATGISAIKPSNLETYINASYSNQIIDQLQSILITNIESDKQNRVNTNNTLPVSDSSKTHGQSDSNSNKYGDHKNNEHSLSGNYNNNQESSFSNNSENKNNTGNEENNNKKNNNKNLDINGVASTRCFFCKKIKLKKKGKNRTRLRNLPVKLNYLSALDHEILRKEFKLTSDFNLDIKYRFCNICFKKFLKLVNELESKGIENMKSSKIEASEMVANIKNNTNDSLGKEKILEADDEVSDAYTIEPDSDINGNMNLSESELTDNKTGQWLENTVTNREKESYNTTNKTEIDKTNQQRFELKLEEYNLNKFIQDSIKITLHDLTTKNYVRKDILNETIKEILHSDIPSNQNMDENVSIFGNLNNGKDNRKPSEKLKEPNKTEMEIPKNKSISPQLEKNDEESSLIEAKITEPTKSKSSSPAIEDKQESTSNESQKEVATSTEKKSNPESVIGFKSKYTLGSLVDSLIVMNAPSSADIISEIDKDLIVKSNFMTKDVNEKLREKKQSLYKNEESYSDSESSSSYHSETKESKSISIENSNDSTKVSSKTDEDCNSEVTDFSIKSPRSNSNISSLSDGSKKVNETKLSPSRKMILDLTNKNMNDIIEDEFVKNMIFYNRNGNLSNDASKRKCTEPNQADDKVIHDRKLTDKEDIETDSFKITSVFKKRRLSEASATLVKEPARKETEAKFSYSNMKFSLDNIIESEFVQSTATQNQNDLVSKRLLKNQSINDAAKRQASRSDKTIDLTRSESPVLQALNQFTAQSRSSSHDKSQKHQLSTQQTIDNVFKDIIVKHLKEMPLASAMNSMSPSTSPINQSPKSHKNNDGREHPMLSQPLSPRHSITGSELISQARSYGRPSRTGMQKASPPTNNHFPSSTKNSLNIDQLGSLSPQLLASITQNDMRYSHSEPHSPNQLNPHNNGFEHSRELEQIHNASMIKAQPPRNNSNNSVILMSPSPPFRGSPQISPHMNAPFSLSSGELNEYIRSSMNSRNINFNSSISPSSSPSLASSAATAAAAAAAYLPLFTNGNTFNGTKFDHLLSSMNNGHFKNNGLKPPPPDKSRGMNSPSPNRYVHSPKLMPESFSTILMNNPSLNLNQGVFNSFYKMPHVSKQQQQQNILNSYLPQKINHPSFHSNEHFQHQLKNDTMSSNHNGFEKLSNGMMSRHESHKKFYENHIAQQKEQQQRQSFKKRLLTSVNNASMPLHSPIHELSDVPLQVSSHLIPQHFLNGANSVPKSHRNN